MDIGEEKERVRIEPVEDPFRKPSEAPEKPVEAPTEPEKVEVPA